MPIGGYYKGKGEQVMAEMQRRYGTKGGQRVFYATANKRGLKPGTGDAANKLAAMKQGNASPESMMAAAAMALKGSRSQKGNMLGHKADPTARGVKTPYGAHGSIQSS